jgi:putative Ig domain-containing protein/calcineurin-like phosphoesterase family protein
MTRKVPTGRARLLVAVVFVGSAFGAVLVPAASQGAGPTTITFGAAGDFGANSATAASLNELDSFPNMDFFMAVGDLDYGEVPSPEAWCDYIKARLPHLPTDFPFELLGGNHEENTILQHAACLPDRLGSTPGPGSQYAVEYSFDYPPSAPLVRVVMISPALKINGVTLSYAKGSAHYNWVADSIDDARTQSIPWTVVGMHKNCFTSSSSSCEIGADLMNMLVEKKVDLVIQGHKHTYQRGKQLALGTGCAAVTGSYDVDCVVDHGSDDVYSKGRGTVVLIIGCFGQGGSSSPGGYFVKTGSGDGFTKFTVTADRIDASFINATSSFTDSYAIVPNQAPAITNPPGNQTHTEAQSVTLPVTAVDPEGDAITYSATGLPPGLLINATSGVISGTIAGTSAGTYATTLRATDTGLLSGTAQLIWTVKDAPPATPANLMLARHTTGVGLDWADNADSDLAGYNVARSASVAGPFTKLNAQLLVASEYFDATAPVGTLSYYQVTAVDTKGSVSPPSSGNVRRSKIFFVSGAGAKAAATSLQIPKPAGVQPGDVMLAAITVRGSAVILAPEGWSLVSDVSRTLTLELSRQAIYSRVATAIEASSYSFGFLVPSSAVGSIVAYRGASGISSRAAGQANPASNLITAPSITSLFAGSVQVGFFGMESDALIGAPAGMMSKGSDLLSTSSLKVALGVADVVVDLLTIPPREAAASQIAQSIGQVIILNPGS